MRLTVMPTPTEENLRLLYLDWCSTQVAKRFLELSHDEVWLRSHLASVRPEEPAEPLAPQRDDPVGPVDRIPGYLDLVRKTALLLAEEMHLPTFVEWKDVYLRDPEGVGRELLGG
jgi:hypothetical protein